MDRRTVIFVLLMTATFFVINHFVFPPKATPAAAQITTEKNVESPPLSLKDEKLYVIENGYQQLVISSVNGALAEVNLILQNQEHPRSVVKAIETDVVMKNEYPQYDRFPKGPYTSYEGSFNEGVIGGYYPLLRRQVSSANYYGLAITSSGEEKNTIYHLNRIEKNSIELEGTTGGVRLKKIYRLPEDASLAPYSFEFTVFAETDPSHLAISTGIPEVELVSGSFTPSLKYRLARKQKGAVVEQISLPKETVRLTQISPEWISNSNGFFAVLIDPMSEMGSGFWASYIPGNLATTRLSVIDKAENRFPGYDIKLPFKKESGTYQFRIFAGPLDSTILKNNDLIYKEDYLGMRSFHGWFSFISEPFAKFLFFLMKIFYAAVGSWGISIILLTIALRFMMYPLNAWSIRSNLKMQKLAPKLGSLQERHKKDPKTAQLEIMKLYKENGVNPLGGCFPLLIQMPFLIGMFDLLKSTFELRGASFIPFWITNLTAPDVIFSWNTPLWFIGNSFHLLPILLGGVMLWQQRMSGITPKNNKLLTEQQKQQKMMGNIMVGVFTILFYNFPSGLNLYWLSSMLLAILQQWWMTKFKPKKAT